MPCPHSVDPSTPEDATRRRVRRALADRDLDALLEAVHDAPTVAQDVLRLESDRLDPEVRQWWSDLANWQRRTGPASTPDH